MYQGQRLSFDGALCTVRALTPDGEIPGTKGDWLGVEWDDVSRGKHDGTYKGRPYFQCKSTSTTAASFIRPTRKPDPERAVLQAIRHKYGATSPGDVKAAAVIISGKIAEEIGFEKIAKEQSVLSDLRVAVLDQLRVCGVAPRGSSPHAIKQAQAELAETCPNISELDLGYNVLESWREIEDICISLPKLRILKLNGLRLHSFQCGNNHSASGLFARVEELHLNSCLVSLSQVQELLGPLNAPSFPILRTLSLSQNEWSIREITEVGSRSHYRSVNNLKLENNLFTSLDVMSIMLSLFPCMTEASLQSNKIEAFGDVLLARKSTTAGSYKQFSTLNLSQNNIQSLDFIDKLPIVFPNLTSLRITRNPAYDQTKSSTAGASTSETTYYLTLARIATLKTLNYTKITPRERDEGEIYYLSVAEREIKALISAIDTNNAKTKKEEVLALVHQQYPRYQTLCQQHDRESLLTFLKSQDERSTKNNAASVLRQPTKPSHPPGALASRLVNATFYTKPHVTADKGVAVPPSDTHTQRLPTTLPTTHVFAIVRRAFNLKPLQFRLVYESEELDPVRDDLTTRSRLHEKGSGEGAARYKGWGEWDVDALVHEGTKDQPGDESTSQSPGEFGGSSGKWTEDGFLLKEGKKWKRREVEILMSLRGWGDFLDLDGDVAGREVRIRVEPKIAMSMT